MRIRTLFAAAALLCASAAAKATLYQFDYTFTDGVSMRGTFDGASSGDLIRITDFISIAYQSPSKSETYSGPLDLYSYGGVPTTSFSGLTQDFSTGFIRYAIDSWWISTYASPTVNDISLARYGFKTIILSAGDSPANTSWVVEAIPEPSTALMLLGGIGLIGIAARRRHA